MGESIYINKQEIKGSKSNDKTFLNIKNNKQSLDLKKVEQKIKLEQEFLSKAQNVRQLISNEIQDSSVQTDKIDNFSRGSTSEQKDKPDKYLEINVANGRIQLGYSKKDKKIILMTDKESYLEKSANFSYNKKIEGSSAKVLKDEAASKKVITQYKAGTNEDSATAIVLAIDTPCAEVIKGYTDIVENTTSQDTSMAQVMKIMDSKNEKDSQDLLKQQIEAGEIDKTVANKSIEHLRDIINTKQRYMLNYNSMIKTAVNKIKYQNTNRNFDDFIEFIKKKRLEEEKVDDQEQIQDETKQQEVKKEESNTF